MFKIGEINNNEINVSIGNLFLVWLIFLLFNLLFAIGISLFANIIGVGQIDVLVKGKQNKQNNK